MADPTWRNPAVFETPVDRTALLLWNDALVSCRGMSVVEETGLNWSDVWSRNSRGGENRLVRFFQLTILL